MGVIEETANRSLPFPFTPLKHHCDPRRYRAERCLRHYSKLLAVAIFMDLSLECSRKAIAVNSNWRPRGDGLDWISISQVHCFLFLPLFFPPSCFVRSGMSLPPSFLRLPAKSSNQLILACFHTLKISWVSHHACFRRSQTPACVIRQLKCDPIKLQSDVLWKSHFFFVRFSSLTCHIL